jgi:LysR family transcriptional regulator, regulator of abg operon
MELRQLRHFLAIIDAGSVSRAAAELGRSQQALSKSLQSLEDSVGVRLLDRGAGQVTPTVFGRMLLPYARNMDAEARGFRAALAAALGAERGRVRVGASPTAASHLVSDAVLRLLGNHPQLQVAVITGLYDDLRPRLASGELDLFVCLENDVHDDPGLEREVLGHALFGVVVGAQHPLARAAQVTAAMLREQPWIMGLGLGEVEIGWRRGFERAGLPLPDVAVETSSLEFTRSALLSSSCVTLLPTALVEAELEQGALAVLEVADLRWSRPMVLHTRRNATLSAPAAALVDALHRAARRQRSPAVAAPGRGARAIGP